MRRQYSFEGRVQGVGFRATARSIARRFPVTGWVRNEPDNSVVLQVQGAEPAVVGFIAELVRVMASNITASSHVSLPEIPGEIGFLIQCQGADLTRHPPSYVKEDEY